MKKYCKKSIVALYAAAVLLLSMLFGACGNQGDTSADTNTDTPADTSQTQEMPSYEKNKVLDGVDIQSVIEYGSSNIAVFYPVLDSSAAINGVIYQMVDDQLTEFRSQLTDLDNGASIEEKPELNITFETFRHKDNLISFKFVIYTAMPQMAHGSNEIKTMTFDLKNEKQISLQDLFVTDHYLQMLSEKAHAHFDDLEGYQDYAGLADGLAPVEENYRNFVVTDDDLEFDFDPYQIASGSMGMPTWQIPIGEIKQFMSPDLLEDGTAGRGNEPSESPSSPVQASGGSQENAEELKDKKLIAITFDDGPHQTCTPQLLDILKSEEVKATFFVLGSRVEYYPEIVQRAVAEGHQIGNHSYDHKQLTKMSDGGIRDEIDKTNQILTAVTGKPASALRPPYGEISNAIKTNADLPIILWSIDPEDWKYQDAEYVFRAATSGVKDGSIILMHDIYESSVQAAQKVIQELKAQGYTFVTVDTLIRVRSGGEPQNGKVYGHE